MMEVLAETSCGFSPGHPNTKPLWCPFSLSLLLGANPLAEAFPLWGIWVPKVAGHTTGQGGPSAGMLGWPWCFFVPSPSGDAPSWPRCRHGGVTLVAPPVGSAGSPGSGRSSGFCFQDCRRASPDLSLFSGKGWVLQEDLIAPGLSEISRVSEHALREPPGMTQLRGQQAGGGIGPNPGDVLLSLQGR